jgi:predicted dehydrogenase
MVRWGIIGCGDVTEVKSGPAFARAAHSSLVAVMRRDAALARDYAARHRVPRWYADAAALVADPEVDAIYVATPPHAHREYALMAARAGKPVYVEKPMALNHAECLEMIDACRAAGVGLFTAYYRRALPRFLHAKALVDDGAIGDPRAVNIALYRWYVPPAGTTPWRVDPARAGGGLFVDLASHMLDLLDYVLGPIARVSGGAANQGRLYAAEDIVTASLEFASGVRGAGVWSFTTGTALDRTEIAGTRGRLWFPTFDEGPVSIETDGGVETVTIPHPAHVQQPLIQSVVDELRGVGSCPSSGVSAARTTRIMDQLLHGYYSAHG